MLVRICDNCGAELPPAYIGSRLDMTYTSSGRALPSAQDPRDFCGSLCLVTWMDQQQPGLLRMALAQQDTVAIVDGRVTVVSGLTNTASS